MLSGCFSAVLLAKTTQKCHCVPFPLAIASPAGLEARLKQVVNGREEDFAMEWERNEARAFQLDQAREVEGIYEEMAIMRVKLLTKRGILAGNFGEYGSSHTQVKG